MMMSAMTAPTTTTAVIDPIAQHMALMVQKNPSFMLWIIDAIYPST